LATAVEHHVRDAPPAVPCPSCDDPLLASTSPLAWDLNRSEAMALSSKNAGSMIADDNTLVIDGLEKRFTSHGRAAFRDISFSVGQGEFIALIGP